MFVMKHSHQLVTINLNEFLSFSSENKVEGCVSAIRGYFDILITLIRFVDVNKFAKLFETGHCRFENIHRCQ